MKRFKLYILIAGLIVTGVFSSCSDTFLDVESKTILSSTNFYKTQADAEMALVGCYDGYQVKSTAFSIYLLSGVASDECFGGGGANDGRGLQLVDRFDISQSPADNSILIDTWGKYYEAIFRCNSLLQKLPGLEKWDSGDATTDSIVKNRIEGEARFLRAIEYFDMVRLFENIPLLSVPTKEYVPQANPYDTYKLIVSDLIFAAENIPADAYPRAESATNDGRVTRYAAKAMLARVYLFYTGYYGKDDLGITKQYVLEGLEDVISSNEFDLVTDFKTLWPAASYVPDEDNNTLDKSAYAGKGNVEVVFAQKFNSTTDYNGNTDGNRWLVMMGMRNTNFSPYGKGWGACTVNPQYVNSFPSGDTRRTASVIDIVGEGIESSFDINDQREYTGYTVKKYTPTALPDGTSDTGGAKDFQISQDQDYILIRYADVLLMAAELGSSNTLEYFNKVHTRAGLDEVASITQDDIMTERKFEFAFEGIRYWDLLRTGIDNAANVIAASAQTVKSANVPDQVTYDAAQIKATRGFMQIPNTEITLSNGTLTQNPGW
ncbi:RagB/SusD family nutrient uptake outer membrane protein [Labilibaculum sp. K2S]|uniref:RagB/SusD family nutrient uptake outer membrane protein n=1 Tax=Labilibaculum sp. K2S TaxID=3056386 RepID=UPI0025A373E5|nr:RagB/SusD family nutrient uptake outer membrane protein [Labilibaculum sp. K2S]MDM8159334.1 RagB/SusD family nutrient uptake outer membrane protein [Labilibaculum sp. K2S]